ncbi:MAG: transposase [Gammaproteobacteria bacterium]
MNGFRAKCRISNGVVEGMNNKAKPTLEKSYGFGRILNSTEVPTHYAAAINWVDIPYRV